MLHRRLLLEHICSKCRWTNCSGRCPGGGNELSGSLELSLHSVLKNCPHMLQVLRKCRILGVAGTSRRRPGLLVQLQAQLPRPLGEATENWHELKAVLEEAEASEDV